MKKCYWDIPAARFRASALEEYEGVKVGDTWRNNQNGRDYKVGTLLEAIDTGKVEKAKCYLVLDGNAGYPREIGIERFGVAYTLIDRAA